MIVIIEKQNRDGAKMIIRKRFIKQGDLDSLITKFKEVCDVWDYGLKKEPKDSHQR